MPLTGESCLQPMMTTAMVNTKNNRRLFFLIISFTPLCSWNVFKYASAAFTLSRRSSKKNHQSLIIDDSPCMLTQL